MKKTLAGIIGSMAVLAVCLTASPAKAAAVYVNIAPPPLVVETPGVAPHPGYVWIGGYHRWNGTAHVWVPGRWGRPPHPHAVWVPARWKHGPRGWYSAPGRWR